MRNKLLVAAAIIVGLSTVAYAAFAQLLTINGTGTATGNWDVRIISITPTAQTGATDHASTPSYTNTSATFNVDLAYPGATSSYEVVIKNNGTIPAKLSTLTDLTTTNAAAPNDITYSLSGVAVNDTLAAGAQTTATVTVNWVSGASTNIQTQSKSATINFNYIQNT
ncbi:MAG: hypothetical protein KA604_00480 [Candidatus Saccharimonas sp.]|nr:hypothetical protein [Candidatus Saccharimonas sp.]